MQVVAPKRQREENPPAESADDSTHHREGLLRKEVDDHSVIKGKTYEKKFTIAPRDP